MVRDGTLSGWSKSTFCVKGDCVEWLAIEGNVYVRDSKQSRSTVLVFTRTEWIAFIARIKNRSDSPAF